MALKEFVLATFTITGFHLEPRCGRLDILKCVYTLLHIYKNTEIKFNSDMNDYSEYKFEKVNWE